MGANLSIGSESGGGEQKAVGFSKARPDRRQRASVKTAPLGARQMSRVRGVRLRPGGWNKLMLLAIASKQAGADRGGAGKCLRDRCSGALAALANTSAAPARFRQTLAQSTGWLGRPASSMTRVARARTKSRRHARAKTNFGPQIILNCATSRCVSQARHSQPGRSSPVGGSAAFVFEEKLGAPACLAEYAGAPFCAWRAF